MNETPQQRLTELRRHLQCYREAIETELPLFYALPAERRQEELFRLLFLYRSTWEAIERVEQTLRLQWKDSQ